jgi:predicted O-methyltransferase YrrM
MADRASVLKQRLRAVRRRGPMSVVAALLVFVGGCSSSDSQPRTERSAGESPGSAATPGDCSFSPPTAAESISHYSREYRFSSDWFTPNVPHWLEAIGHLKGKPEVHYLEVGLYEGRSAIWMLEHILTHPDSTLTGIDVFPGDLESIWRANLALNGAEERATTLKGFSQSVLRGLPLDFYDIVYIDGSHKGPDVLADAVLSWYLLEEDGFLILDDYQWRRGEREPPELRPGHAIDAFITLFRDSLVVRHRCYQVIVQKIENPCQGREHCSPFGPYEYDWRARRLVRVDGRSAPELDREETDLIEEIINGRRYGYTEYEVPADRRQRSDFVQLSTKIDLSFVR